MVALHLQIHLFLKVFAMFNVVIEQLCFHSSLHAMHCAHCTYGCSQNLGYGREHKSTQAKKNGLAAVTHTARLQYSLDAFRDLRAT
jgi:hypothetical protein